MFGHQTLESPDSGSGLEGGVIPQNDKTCTIDLSQMQNVISGKVFFIYKNWYESIDKSIKFEIMLKLDELHSLSPHISA